LGVKGVSVSLFMEAFLVSTGVVALAEFGDKSQLLVLALAVRFRKPIPIILGMLAATVVNHAVAGVAGTWLASMIDPISMRWLLGLSFVGIALWTLIPEWHEETAPSTPGFGVFGATVTAFFLLEMGDKTQIATIALAAKYGSLLAVVGGSTFGIMLADVPLVMLGALVVQKLPLRSLHRIAPAMFLVLGIIVLLGIGVGL
jgi:putative Ca2+/H+ antiporter (TMEM165/GDT1 family)